MDRRPTRRELATGVRLAYRRVGAGGPLALIMVTACTLGLWAPVESALAARHHVISFDNRSLGGSDRGEGPHVTWFEGQEGYASVQHAQYFDCDFFTALNEDPSKSNVVGKNAVALPPHAEDKQPFSNVWTWALGMSARAADKNAAWYFIQWATAKQQMLKATLDGQNYNPTRKLVFDNADVQNR